MFARKRLDIQGRDLLMGLSWCVRPVEREVVTHALESLWATNRNILATYSVRTGFDLLWQCLSLPEGSEVIITSITIPHMAQILRHHGLIPVPIELDLTTCETPAAFIESAITPKTRAIVVTHLFGARVSIEPVLDLAQRYGLMIVEDCAQTFLGLEYDGDPRADVSMFSFGTIKTATALGGAIFSIKDAELKEQMDELQSAYPKQPTVMYARKLLKSLAMVYLGQPTVYAAFIKLVESMGLNYDTILRSMSRGFSGPDFFFLIRHQMSDALLALLYHRLKNYEPKNITSRMLVNKQFASMLDEHVLYFGAHALNHSFWVFAIVADNAQELMFRLREEGFDATNNSSSLIAILPEKDEETISPQRSVDAMKHVVYLPVYEGISSHDLERLAALVNEHARSRSLPPAATPVSSQEVAVAEEDDKNSARSVV